MGKLFKAVLGEIQEKGFKTVLKEGGTKVLSATKEKGLKMLGGVKEAFFKQAKDLGAKGLMVGTAWTGANIAAATGDNIIEKTMNGVGATKDQFGMLTSAAGKVAEVGGNALGCVQEAVESGNPMALFKGVADQFGGLINKGLELIPEEFRKFAVPAAIMAGAFAFSNSGLLGQIAVIGMAAMAFAGNAGGIKDAAMSMLGMNGAEAQAAGAKETPALDVAIESLDDTKALAEHSLASGAEPVYETPMPTMINEPAMA